MNEIPEMDLEALLDLATYAFLRLDGAWFIAAAEKHGVGAATDLDVVAWETFSERLARRIVSKLNLHGEFCQVLPVVARVQQRLMRVKGEFSYIDENRVIFRVNDCEVWKMVSKVWTSETAPCYKVTQGSLRGMLKGAFPGMDFTISHDKKIPLGDSCCEVEIVRKNSK